MSEQPLLDVKGLQVHFHDAARGRKVHAVEDASFTIPHNAFVGLTGESGSGKTTVALSLLGLSKGAPGIVRGAVRFNGRLVYDAGAWSGLSPAKRSGLIDRAVAPLRGRDLFMIFQEPRASLNPYWKVEAQLTECLQRNGRRFTPAELSHELEVLLDHVWLPQTVLGMYPAELSTGMCQRIMIAMALAMKVKLLLADEPLSRIDLRLRRKVVTALERIHKERAMAMLLSTHDLDLIRHLADTVVVMYKGRVVEIGPTETVLDSGKSPKHEYTARLLATFDMVESARGQTLPDGAANAFDAVLRSRLRKQIPPGREMAEVEKGHWLLR